MSKTGEMTISVDTLQEIVDEINEIDERIAATSGSEAGNTSVRNSLIREYKDEAEALAQPVIDSLSAYSGEALVGILNGVLRLVDSAHSEEADEALKALVEERRSKVAPLSAEEMESIAETRKDRLKAFNTLKTTLSLFGLAAEVEKIESPKSRIGPVGKRGPTIWNKFQYVVNDAEYPEEMNSLAQVAKRAGLKVSEFKELMAQNSIDVKNIDKHPTWSIQVSPDLRISAYPLEAFSGDFEFSEEEEED